MKGRVEFVSMRPLYSNLGEISRLDFCDDIPYYML